MLGSAESEKVRLISREIIFAEFATYMITIHQRHRQTDGRGNLPWQYRAPPGFIVRELNAEQRLRVCEC